MMRLLPGGAPHLQVLLIVGFAILIHWCARPASR